MPDAPLDGLEIIYVPIGTLVPNPWNPNVMDDATFEAERESIRAYGFIDPVLVRKHPDGGKLWQIIDGEHRVKAAKEEGHEQAPVTPLVLTDVAAKKLTIILNETRGEADVALLGKLLADIEADIGTDELRLGLPYTAAEMAHLLEIGNVNWDAWAAENPPTEPRPGDDEAPVHSVQLVFASKRQHDKFVRLAGMLQREWEVDVTQAVVKAVTTAAEAL